MDAFTNGQQGFHNQMDVLFAEPPVGSEAHYEAVFKKYRPPGFVEDALVHFELVFRFVVSHRIYLVGRLRDASRLTP